MSQNSSSTAAKSASSISRFTVFSFGAGAIGEAVYVGLFNTFIVLFYNQVIGLSNSLIGLAIMLALIGDAITDPLVGIISDRWRSRHGRRHPFLFFAPVPMAISIYLIFNPPQFLQMGPDGPSQMGLFVWLTVLTIASRALNTLYAVPHLALGGELTKDQNKRSQLFSVNMAMASISGMLFGFLAYGYFFAGERVRASDGKLVPGHLDAAAYSPLILFGCSVIVIAIWASAAGTYKQVAGLSQANDQLPRITFKEFFREIASTFKNSNYVFLLIGFFFFMITSGIYDTMAVFMKTYYWELLPEDIRWFSIVAGPMGIIGALITPALNKRFDRKPVLIGSLIGVIIFTQLVIDLRLLGWLPANGDPMLLPILLANAAAFAMSIGVGAVTVTAMIADVIDENELQTERRQEGLFYSARAFFAKASNSFGHFFAGILLDVYVRLPFDAVPGELESDVLFRMGILAGPAMGVAAIIAVFIYNRYNLSRERHQEIIVQLKQRENQDSAATSVSVS